MAQNSVAKADFEAAAQTPARAAPQAHVRAQADRLKALAHCRVLACVVGAFAAPLMAQTLVADRLDTGEFDVLAPSQRVLGAPGSMHIAERSCPALPSGDLRRRIVDLAVQEWGFFGFTVVDQTEPEALPPPGPIPQRRRPWLDQAESERVASSIAGYWSITPDGSWIIERQNAMWKGELGVGERWRDPWSAAFISWVMCESGLSKAGAFRPAIAHHVYIDAAIENRRAEDGRGAYTAFDVGETPIEPGDLLCSARRHGYRNLADRERRIGEGARTHCDIVVRVDAAKARILAIGGNVRGRVSLKLLFAPVARETAAGILHARVGHDGRRVFAHLKLDAPSIQADALETAPTIRRVTDDADNLAALERVLGLPMRAARSKS
jgi:hypothetical protein